MAVAKACPECRIEAGHVARVLQIVAAGTGSATLPSGVDVRVSYGGLSIRAREAQGLGETSGWLEVPALAGVAGKSATIAAPGQVGELDLAAGTLSARLRELTVGSDPVAVARAHAREWEGFSVLLDAAACGVGQLGGRLWVSGPELGEVLCPLGMHGQSKKLSDLLIDAKVEASLRGAVPVVRSGVGGPVVWVAPLRADERARVTSATRVALELSWRPNE